MCLGTMSSNPFPSSETQRNCMREVTAQQLYFGTSDAIERGGEEAEVLPPQGCPYSHLIPKGLTPLGIMYEDRVK